MATASSEKLELVFVERGFLAQAQPEPADESLKLDETVYAADLAMGGRFIPELINELRTIGSSATLFEQGRWTLVEGLPVGWTFECEVPGGKWDAADKAAKEMSLSAAMELRKRISVYLIQ